MNLDKLRSQFEGHIETDEESLLSVSTDFGRLVCKTPLAIAVPFSSDDVSAAVRFANEEGWSISSRGAAHAQGGQSLNQGGLLLDMVGLSQIGPVEEEAVWVDAGVLWGDLVDTLIPEGWVPPVLTSNLNVSIGGTLSFGGLGVASHRYGSQADNVLALEVVTGTGDLVLCSPEENSDLFDCVRCGAGQFGLITRAKLSVRRFLPNVRTFYLLYDDLDALMHDQRRVAKEGRFDFTEAWCSPCVQGQKRLGETTVSFAEWFFPVQLTVEYDTAAPSFDGILSSFKFYRSVYLEDSKFPDYLRRMEPLFQQWRESGSWNRAHPWMEVLLPWDRAAEYIQGVLKGLPPALVSGGQVLLWTCATGRSRSPLFVHPEGDLIMGFAIHSAVRKQAVGMAVSLMERASDLVVQVGGNRYLSGWVPFDHSRWKMHYGNMWPQVVQWKKFFDPEGVLNPGFIAFTQD